MAVPTSPDDQELARLMTLAQAGDRDAYARVLRGCLDIIGGLRTDGGASSPIDQIAIDTCLSTIHAARHTFDPRRSFVLWVTAIACHHGLLRRSDARPGSGRHAAVGARLGGLEVST